MRAIVARSHSRCVSYRDDRTECQTYWAPWRAEQSALEVAISVDWYGNHPYSVYDDGLLPSVCFVTVDHRLSCRFMRYDATTAEPRTVARDVRHASVGWDHVCAIKVDGAVWCAPYDPWNLPESDELRPRHPTDGLLTKPRPALEVDARLTNEFAPWRGTMLSLGTDNEAIASSGDSACVLKQDGWVWCWGTDEAGAAGLKGERSSEPVRLDALGSDVASISLGRRHGCAVKRDGTLWCWGQNRYALLGNGRSSYGVDELFDPAPVPGLPGPTTAVAAAEWHTCAVSNGELFCWGANVVGQLGNGDLPGSRSVEVAELPSPVLGCP